MAAQRGVDGASRDARGNLRFNKNTKRSRMEEDELMEIEEPVRASAAPEKKKKKDAPKKLGEEFRAKVSLVIPKAGQNG